VRFYDKRGDANKISLLKIFAALLPKFRFYRSAVCAVRAAQRRV